MSTKIKLFITIIVMVFLFAGCNLEEKIGENITEGFLEKVGKEEDLDIEYNDEGASFSTDEGEVTFDEDGYTFKGNDGEVVTVGGNDEWPQGMAADLIPKLDAGVIDSTVNTEDGCMLVISGVSQEDYRDYKEKVIEEGYTEDSSELKSDDGEYYMAYNGETYIYIYYYATDSTISITLALEDE